MPPRRRRALLASLSLTVLSLAACSVSPTAMPMHDGTTVTPGGGVTGPMMEPGDGAGGYRWSRTTCEVPTSVPGTPVSVMLGDMGMAQMMGGQAPTGDQMMLRAVPMMVRHGTVTLVAYNRGWRVHELVVLPLGPDRAAGEREVGGDGKVDEAGTLAEASSTCEAGHGEGIAAGSAGWVTVDLPAGRYELVCNLENHYADGMRQVLVVT